MPPNIQFNFDFNSNVEYNLTPVGLFPQTSLLSP